ncbi:RNA-DNA hybrid ribonuclease [Martiniozyma asiatica (nom. inval.)]|nr:RNA-DNA hybrid ribonuclease [Martiniozyma asiatica]
MKFYAVANGRQKGIFNDWSTCKSKVDHFPNAKFKSFKTKSEALSWIDQNSTANKTNGKISKPKISKPSNMTNFSKISFFSSNPTANTTVVTPRSINSKSKNVSTIYTDGASRNNQNKSLRKAGYGVWFGENDPRNISERVSGEQTNQRAELQAIDRALDVVIQEIHKGEKLNYEIATDSQYSINCLTKWHPAWQKNGWKSKLDKPVVNQDVIKGCVEKLDKIKKDVNITFKHVKGHSGIYGNEMADKLAVAGALK